MSAKNIIVVVSLVLSVVIGLVLAQGGRGPGVSGAKGGRPLIGLSLDTLKEERWQHDRDMFEARCKELGADVKTLAANSDDTKQMTDVEALITSKVDVIVIVPHDGKAMAVAVEKAHAAGIPVIAYDRLIKDSDLDLYMSFDNVRVGEEQAKYLLAHLPTPGKGKLVRVFGSKTDNNAFLFKQGQDNILKPYIDKGDIKVLHEDWAEDWKPDNGKKIVNAAITKYGKDFDGILAANDGTAGGAIQALTEEGLAKKILVTGQDAELVACQRIVGGTQVMTVYKPLKVLATAAAETAVTMARRKIPVANSKVNNGKIDVPSILCDVIPVDKDNMMDTVIKDGFLKKDDVYTGAAAATTGGK